MEAQDIKMNIDKEFQEQIYYLDMESIKSSSDIIYIVDHEMRLMAYNRAWNNFARNNGGDIINEKFPLGTKVTEVGEEPLQSYIAKKYREAIAGNTMFELTYECSSKKLLRIFRLNAYPLLAQKGLVISHHLVKECHHTDKITEFNRRFENRDGMIVQCQNCRKIRDPDNSDRWLWVPSMLDNAPTNISHGICSRCMDHYYPDII